MSGPVIRELRLVVSVKHFDDVIHLGVKLVALVSGKEQVHPGSKFVVQV